MYGSQDVHIAPEAFSVAESEFPEEIKFWQDSLPGDLKGNLISVREQVILLLFKTQTVIQLDGAQVLAIDGKPPLQVVDENALIAGGYQGFGTRQNG